MTMYYIIFTAILTSFTAGYCWGAYEQRHIKDKRRNKND